MKTVRDFTLGGSKITADGDGSHEIKRCLLPWEKSYDQPRQHIKKQRHYFANKGPSSQSYHCFIVKYVSSVQFSYSVMSDSVTPWTAAHQASLSVTNSQSLLKLMSIESVMPSSHLVLCHPLLLLPSIFPSIRVFSNESVLHIRWPKYWSFSFSISPSNEYSGLISFRMDWLYLLEIYPCCIQGCIPLSPRDSPGSSPTPQFKGSILWCSSFLLQSNSHIHT